MADGWIRTRRCGGCSRAESAGNSQPRWTRAVPYVVALARTHSDLPFQPQLVAGAMFGNLQITFPVGPDVTADVPAGVRTSFGGSGRVQPEQFRGLSAVALIHGYNPTQIRVEQAINERIGRHQTAANADEP